MKKLISVMLVMMMVLALAAPAFASEEGSVTAAAIKPEVVGDVLDSNGEKVDVTVTQPTMTEALQEDVEQAVEEAVAAGATGAVAGEVFDIQLTDDPNGDGQLESPVTVTIVRDKNSDEVVAVMYQDESDGSWDSAEFYYTSEGNLVVTFQHFCTVVLATTGAPRPAQSTSGTTTTTTTTTSNTSKGTTSPKTGW